jgi:hypothetical protein
VLDVPKTRIILSQIFPGYRPAIYEKNFPERFIHYDTNPAAQITVHYTTISARIWLETLTSKFRVQMRRWLSYYGKVICKVFSWKLHLAV